MSKSIFKKLLKKSERAQDNKYLNDAQKQKMIGVFREYCRACEFEKKMNELAEEHVRGIPLCKPHFHIYNQQTEKAREEYAKRKAEQQKTDTGSTGVLDTSANGESVPQSGQ